MASSNVTVEILDFEKITEYIQKQGKNNQDMIDEYYQEMQKIKESVIMSGAVSDSLTNYIENVQKMLTVVGEDAGVVKTKVEKFESKIKNTDKYN